MSITSHFEEYGAKGSNNSVLWGRWTYFVTVASWFGVHSCKNTFGRHSKEYSSNGILGSSSYSILQTTWVWSCVSWSCISLWQWNSSCCKSDTCHLLDDRMAISISWSKSHWTHLRWTDFAKESNHKDYAQIETFFCGASMMISPSPMVFASVSNHKSCLWMTTMYKNSSQQIRILNITVNLHTCITSFIRSPDIIS